VYLNDTRNVEFGRKLLVYKTLAVLLEVEKELTKMKVVYRKDSIHFTPFLNLPLSSKLKYVRC
jgi:hypothetical protein